VSMLLATLAVAHFWRVAEFGLYEDDYYFVGEPIGWTTRMAATDTVERFLAWPQGRPFNTAGTRLLAYVGFRFAGLAGVRALGVIILAANVILVFSLASRRMALLPGLVAALTFCLFAADTTKILLTHAIALQGALLFGLFALHRFAQARPRRAYVWFTAALLTYESAALPFLLAPLLTAEAWRPSRRTVRRHLGICGLIAAAIVAVRLLMSESRLTEAAAAGWWALLERALGSLALGPVTSATLMVTRPIEAARGWNALPWGLLSVQLALLLVALSAAWFAEKDGRGFCLPKADHALRGDARTPSWQLFVGLALWIAGYALAFTHWPPTTSEGRLTSVHLAATFGCAWTLGAAAWLVIRRLADRPILAKVFLIGLALYFTLLSAFHQTVQVQFATSWRDQRSLWSQVVALCLDLEDGTIVFLRPDGIPLNRMARVSSWADPLVLELLYRFPRSWSSVPRAFALDPEIVASFEEVDGVTRWRVPNATWSAHVVALDRENVIVLESAEGGLRRVDGVAIVNAIPIPSKPRAQASVATLSRGPLFGLLIDRGRP